jgi:exonuclease SbcC
VALAKAEKANDAAVRELERLTGELEDLQGLAAGKTEALTGRIRPYTGSDPAKADLDGIMAELSGKAALRKSLAEDHQTLDRRCAEDAKGLEGKREREKAKLQEIEDGRLPLEDAGAKAAALKAERNGLFGELDPESEEKRLRRAVKDAEESSASLKDSAASARNALEGLTRGVAEAETRAAEALAELGEREAKLDEGLAAKGFTDAQGAPDLPAFLAARLAEDERKALEEASEALASERTRLVSLVEDNARNGAAKLREAEEATAGTLEEELDAARELKGRIDVILGEVGAREQKLKANTEAREKSAGLAAELKEQEKKAARFGRLSSLIGSASGDRFRNFAQGLTLGALIQNANGQLRGMSNRYLLARERDDSLEFAVIDNFNAGKTRPVKTLSGGETFIVSLALALGLADMKGRGFRLQSLFLDEGFGTLDDESLEFAVNALAELPGSSGKLVGLITHVAALKNRFAQITVEPVRNGRSVLTGPGCRRVG